MSARVLFIALLTLPLGSPLAAEGVYVTGSIGASDANTVAGVFGSRFRDIAGDDSGLAVGIGYEIGDIFALEASYQDYGDFTGTRNRCAAQVCVQIAYPSESVSAKALLVSAVARFPIGDRLTGYGRLGVADWEFDGSSPAFDESGQDALLGVGLRWAANARWSLFTEYSTTNRDIDALSVGINYGFSGRD